MPATTAENVTIHQVRKLRERAVAERKAHTILFCDLALYGDYGAIVECARMIRERERELLN